eukprot:5129949-Prorocentrum_lima.AAC.1
MEFCILGRKLRRSSFTAWASATANLTTALLVPVGVVCILVIGNKKWEAPESHIANGSPGSLISIL